MASRINSRKNRNTYYYYSVLFFLFGIIVYSPLLVLHKSFVMDGDCFNQYFPILSYLSSYTREFFNNLIQGKLTMFDPSIGLGDDVIGTLSWFGFGDVFMLLASLFPKAYISYAYTFITIIRIYFSGITFIYFAKNKGISNEGQFIGAFMYVFCYYAIGFSELAFTFSTPMVYFPLVICGIDRIVDKETYRDKSICRVLVIAVFLESLCGFYFLYMMILASLVYYFSCCVTCMFRNKVSIKRIINNAICVILHFSVGIGMAAALLLPVIVSYLQSQRTGDSSANISKIFALASKSDTINALKNIITPPYSCGEKGLSVPIFALVCFVYILLRINDKRYRRKSVFLIILFMAYFFPLIGYIANGLAYSTTRWSFIMFFYLSFMVASMFNEVVNEFTKRDSAICIVLFVVWLIIEVLLQEKNDIFSIRIVVYSLIWISTIILLLLYNSQRVSHIRIIHRIILFTVISNTILNAFLFFAPSSIGGSGIGGSFKALNSVNPEIMESKLAENSDKYNFNDSFHRFDFNDTAIDAPLMLGINSTYSYYSICNGSVFDIYNDTRISPAIMDTFCLQGVDGRQVLESILSVRKFAMNSNDCNIVDNDYYLPIGFTYDSYISENEVMKYDYLQRMNILMSDIVLDTTDLHDMSVNSFCSDNKERIIPIDIKYGDGIEKTGNQLKVSKGASISLSFDPSSENEPGEEYYVYLKNLTSVFSDNDLYKADISIDDKYVRIRSKENEWFYNNDYDYLVQVQNAKSKGKIDIVFQESGVYSLDSVEIIDNYIGNFAEKYNKLNEDVLEDVRLEDNKLMGDINLSSGKWLFVSFPYSKGWSCTIDGKEAKIVKANYSFMSVFVPQGKHEIVFSYVTPGIKLGMFISLIAVLFFIIWNVLCSHHNSKNSIGRSD